MNPSPSPTLPAPANTNRRTIGGIEFEAVRETRPIPRWRARVVATGYLYEAGCFHSKSRPQLWESIEDGARHRGSPLWESDNLTAHADDHARKQPSAAPFVLWGSHPSHNDGQPLKLAGYSRNETVRRTREGWICAAYRVGDEPEGLRLMADARREACVSP